MNAKASDSVGMWDSHISGAPLRAFDLAEDMKEWEFYHEFFYFFEVKTFLDVVGIELDWPVTLGSVTLVRVKSARVTAIWIGDRHMRWMKLFISMTENNFIDWYTLHYQE